MSKLLTFLIICCSWSDSSELAGTMSDARGGLSLLRVAGGCRSGLSGKRVHGTEELICDATGLAETAQQGAVDCGRVIPDGVLTSEEQTRDRLGGKERPH